MGSTSWPVDRRPTIIIHGTGQSEVFLCGERGELLLGANGKPIRSWIESIDPMPRLRRAVPSLLASLLLRRDAGLTKAVRRAVEEAFSLFRSDENGRPLQNRRTERQHRMNGLENPPTSLAEVPNDWWERTCHHIPLQSMEDAIGRDNIYYFAYDSLGFHPDAVEELYGLIQEVLQKHGTDQVNLMPISQGGTVMNALAAYCPQVKKQLRNVVYVVPAFDGSIVVGDLLCGRLAQGGAAFYRELLGLKGWQGRLVGLLLRLMPKGLLPAVLLAGVEGLMGVMSRCTMIWALLPKGDYLEARGRWLSGPALAGLAEQTDRYYRAQCGAARNIRDMQALGVRLYDIADYNRPLPGLLASGGKVNADGIIDLDSASMGAVSGPVDTPLPEDYRAAADPKYLSPDGIVDASTGVLPDTTFYFKNQHHERTSRNDEIIRLTTRLVSAANPETVDTLAGEFPQFNDCR